MKYELSLKQKKLSDKDFPVVYLWSDDYGWTSSHIRWDDLERIMGKQLYKRWNKWAMGSTSHIDGAYPWDVRSFLNGERNLD